MKVFPNFILCCLFFTTLNPIMSLDSSPFDPKKMFTMRGIAPSDGVGFSVKNAGDINNDGYDDILLGAYGQNNQLGAVYIIYGGENLQDFDLASTTFSPQIDAGFVILGNTVSFGFAVSSAGDINNDGYDDFIIGASQYVRNRGAAFIIYGGEKSSLSNIDLYTTSLDPLTTGFMITGDARDDYFGYSISSAGDINKDGYDDIVIGASGKSVVYVVYGGEKSSMSNIDLAIATLDPATTGFMITGSALSDTFGGSVSSGDINNDGYSDLVIGATSKSGNTGAVYVIYGGPKASLTNMYLSSMTLNPTQNGFVVLGSIPGDTLGVSISTGDVNKDGYDDIIVGASYKNGARGAAYVIYGGEKSSMANIDLASTTLNPLTTGFMITGSAVNDFLGFSVSSAGDINQDGYHDVIIGALNKNVGQGAAYVIYGGKKSSMKNIDLGSATLDHSSDGFTIFGTEPNSIFGGAVGAADINNDGFSDLLIGASGENLGAGTIYVVVYNQCSENCDICTVPSTCDVCSLGYGTWNSVCKVCPAHCEACTISSECDTCSAPYMLYSRQCLAKCPKKTFAENGKCQNCPKECSECTSLSTCQSCIDGFTLSESQCTPEKGGEKAAAGVFEGTSLIGASLGSGSSLPLNFGLVAKILRNIKYMKLPVSHELYETFVSWKVASGFMSAPKSWRSKYNSRDLPVVFSRYGLQSAFLINFWKPFSMALIGLALFGIFKALEVCMKTGNEKQKTIHTVSRQVNIAASNFALTQIYSNLDDVIFYFTIELRATEFNTGFAVFSLILALIFFMIGGIFIGLHSKLLSKYQNLKEEKGSSSQLEAFVMKCENIRLLMRDFKDTNFATQSFLMINVSRAIISSFIFGVFYEHPILQIFLLFVLNISMIAYLLAKKPFKELIDSCGQIFCEIVLLIANICVFILTMYDHSKSYPVGSIERLSKCIIVLNFLLLFGCALLMLASIGKMFYTNYQEKQKAQKVVQTCLPSDNSNIFTSAKFLRPNQSLEQSATSGGIINDSQNHLQPDSYRSSLEATGDPKRISQLNIPNNSSIQNQMWKKGPTDANGQQEGLEMSSSNVIFQARQTEGSGDLSQSNLFSNSNYLHSSQLLQNSQMNNLRVPEDSKMEENLSYMSPESRIQDPSFHSRMGLDQEGVMDQDLCLTNLESLTDSPPLRALNGGCPNLVPRRKIRKNEDMILGVMRGKK